MPFAQVMATDLHYVMFLAHSKLVYTRDGLWRVKMTNDRSWKVGTGRGNGLVKYQMIARHMIGTFRAVMRRQDPPRAAFSPTA